MILVLAQQVASDSSAAIIHKNSDLFLKIDPWGIGMTVIGYVVVFIALLFLYLIFSNLTRVLNFNLKRLLVKTGKIQKEEKKDLSLSGEVNAAIAMALHLYFSETHDKESYELTIKKVSRTYSPWSSKIYGLRQHPR
jgi:Na+-transporting methylmalonyl-CoA/oxaloacetate decarboxylase gamma subunit